jgi:anti-anti-sigma factor
MSTQPPGSILYARKDKVLCIRLEGRMTFSLGPGFTDFIGLIFARDDWTDLVVDLTGTAAIDSTTLGLLAKIARLLRQRRNQTLVVVSSQERITATLRSVGLERLMTIVPPAGSAVDHLTALPTQEGDKAEQSRVVLDAHRELMALNEQNAAQFRTVVEFLEKEGTGGGEG